MNLLGTEKLRILVTAIGGAGHGEQILKALRLAVGNRYYIIGADAQPDCPQFDLVDESCLLPLASDPRYLDVLLEYCAKKRVNVLFHGCEPELKIMSRERERIAGCGIFLPINPASVIDLCMNKKSTNECLSELGFEPPKYLKVSTRAELETIDWFPVVVKPSVGGGGSANIYIAQNLNELIALSEYLGLESVLENCLIQEYVGTPDEEYTVGVLHDLDGNYINAIAVKRLMKVQMNLRLIVPNRTNRTDLGPRLVISSGISHGYVGRFPAVTEPCKKIARAIGAKGPINIQCRLVNGKVKVFEINPRYSGTTSIRAMVGYNEPDVLIRRHVFGEFIPPDFPYEEALVLRSLVEKRMST